VRKTASLWFVLLAAMVCALMPVLVSAQAQQAALGTLVARQRVVLRSADGAEQDRVRLSREAQGGLRQRVARRVEARAPDGRLLHLQRELQAVQYPDRLGDDLGSDPVPREHRDLHGVTGTARAAARAAGPRRRGSCPRGAASGRSRPAR